jgi:hypothetical protein
MASFSLQVGNFAGKSLKQMDQVRRASILELFSLVILGTPVDTGRLRGNWQTTINSPTDSVRDKLDKSGSEAIADVAANLGGLMDVVWFVNNLPYAEAIEMGGSRQAPAGMVRKNVALWDKIVANKTQAYAG